jgi:hypothetical protein
LGRVWPKLISYIVKNNGYFAPYLTGAMHSIGTAIDELAQCKYIVKLIEPINPTKLVMQPALDKCLWSSVLRDNEYYNMYSSRDDRITYVRSNKGPYAAEPLRFYTKVVFNEKHNALYCVFVNDAHDKFMLAFYATPDIDTVFGMTYYAMNIMLVPLIPIEMRNIALGGSYKVPPWIKIHTICEELLFQSYNNFHYINDDGSACRPGRDIINIPPDARPVRDVTHLYPCTAAPLVYHDRSATGFYLMWNNYGKQYIVAFRGAVCRPQEHGNEYTLISSILIPVYQ